jgi:hypothetical protein
MYMIYFHRVQAVAKKGTVNHYIVTPAQAAILTSHLFLVLSYEMNLF